jgi:hypothetical protein
MTEKEAPVQEQEEKKKKKKKLEPLAKGQMLHHVIRVISRSPGAQGGAWTLPDIEAYLADYTNHGWTLFSTHYLGELPEGYTMLWVLAKDS